MISIYRYFTSALLLLLSVSAFAQPIRQDTLATPGIRIGVEVGQAAWSYIFPDVRQYELSADYGWGKRFYIVTEIGRAVVRPDFQRPDTASFNYAASGFYQRLGFDYNLLKGNEMVFTGLRYAYSRYTDQYTNIVVENPYFSRQLVELPDLPARNVTAHWMELVGGVRARVAGQFYMGFVIRYKVPFYRSGDNLDDLPPYYTPGYGRAMRPNRPGFNYYIAYRIPFRR